MPPSCGQIIWSWFYFCLSDVLHWGRNEPRQVFCPCHAVQKLHQPLGKYFNPPPPLPPPRSVYMPQSDSVFSSGVLGGADDRGGHGGDPLRLHALPTYEGHRRATGHPEGQSSPGEWGPAGPPPGAHRAEDPSLINLLWEAQREKKEKSWAPSTLLHSTSGWTSATRSTSQVSPVSPELFKKKTTTTNSFHVTSFNRKTSWCERDLLGWADDVIKKLRVFRVGPSIILVLVFFCCFFFSRQLLFSELQNQPVDDVWFYQDF